MRDFYEKHYENYIKLLLKVFHIKYEDAEDIVHNAFIKAIELEKSYNEKKASYKTWFNYLLFSEAKDYLRIHYKTVRLENQIDERTEEDKIIGFEWSLNDLEELISAYPKPERVKNILRYFFVLGYSAKEISQIENITVTNVTTICHRFRKSHDI